MVDRIELDHHEYADEIVKVTTETISAYHKKALTGEITDAQLVEALMVQEPILLIALTHAILALGEERVEIRDRNTMVTER
jgi:hypothetical protein